MLILSVPLQALGLLGGLLCTPLRPPSPLHLLPTPRSSFFSALPFMCLHLSNSCINLWLQRAASVSTSIIWFSQNRMAKSKNCFHYADLQAELEQIRAHQKTIDAKLKNDVKALEDRHQTDVNFFLSRVSSLQAQFEDILNRCAHAKESVQILKYMIEKCTAPSTSSNNIRNAGNDENPEHSTARQISHINID